MGGAEKRVPADLLLFVGEDQLEATEWCMLFWALHRTALERKRPRWNADTQWQFEQLQKTSAEVIRPHVNGPLCLHFSGESGSAGRHLIFMRPVSRCATLAKKQPACSSHDCRCFVSSSRGAGPSSLQQEGAAALDPHQEKTEDLHTEAYSVNQWPTNLHTSRDCFPSYYLFDHHSITTWVAAQQPPSACIPSTALFSSLETPNTNWKVSMVHPPSGTRTNHLE